MPKLVATDYQIELDGNDLTDDCDQVDLNVELDELDSTTFGNDGARDYEGGLKKGSVQLGFIQNYDAGHVDAVIESCFGDKVDLVLTPKSGSVSTTNPQFTATVLVSKRGLMNGQIGQLSKMSATWPICGPVVRATS
jgi:hypothetical protein